MVLTHWLRPLQRLHHRLSRRQRRALASRRRRSGTGPVVVAQKLEERTLLAAPHPVNLGALDGTNGFRLDGVAAGDQSGRSVSNAGDVNGDGFDDVIVGAYRADPGGNNSSGSSFVVFGKSGGFSAALDLSSLDGNNGFRIDGVAADDESGRSVSSAGDVNGDGFGDLIVGASGADPFGESAAGTSYVLFGRSGGFAAVVSAGALNGTNGFRILGAAAGDNSGGSVSSAGDVNADGFDDLLVGADGADPNGNASAGSTYLIFGRSNFAPAFDLFNASNVNGTTAFRLDGVATNDQAGYFVDGAGDVNGDGWDDLIIGARSADPNALTSSGSSYVLFGRSGGFASTIDLGSLDGTTGFRLDGVAASDFSGGSVGEAGDVNGDGFDDLIVGARGADPNGNSGAGSSYVVFGRSKFSSVINLSTLNGTTGVRFDGVAVSDASGISVSAAGDVNADSFDDLIVGAWTANPNGNANSGSSYVIFGRSSGFGSAINLSTLDGATGFRIDGENASDYSGGSVSRAGDVNGDGFDDLIVGADFAAPNGSASGSSYVLFGGNFTGGIETQVGTGGPDVLTANQGVLARDVLVGGGGSDIQVSDGGPDVLIGGEGFDLLVIPDADFSGTRRIVGGRGTDQLLLDGAGLTLDLTAVPDNRITGIEEIKLGSFGANGLVVTPREVLRLSDTSNTLSVLGGSDDRVFMAGDDWVFQGIVNNGGHTLHQYTSGAATLNVETDVVITPAVLNVSTLTGTNGFRLDGVAAGDRVGNSVSGAGDVNGDGFEDFIIGADSADPNGITDAGSSYVVFGKSGGYTSAIDLNSLDGTTGFRLDGAAAGDRAGSRVSGAGDVNGDGFDDLIVGAVEADPNGNVASGASYVLFGRSGGFASAINFSTLDGATGFRLAGVDEFDHSGASVSGAGDVNGDGFDDLIVGAYGANPNGTFSGSSYLVFGRSGGFASQINLSMLSGSNGFRIDGVAATDFSGSAVNSAGDVNGDGFEDLIVGAHSADPNGNTEAGSSYVLFGKSGGFASAIDLSSLNGAIGFRLDGSEFGESGFSVDRAGDVNGDGFDDLIVGAWATEVGGLVIAGSSYVVFGHTGMFAPVINLGSLDGATGFRLDGVSSGDKTGWSVRGAGDVNGDGFDDLIVGAHETDPNGMDRAGSSYVVYGRSGGFAAVINLSTLDAKTGFRLDGATEYDRFGWSVSGAGDVNGDGFDDLIVGAPVANPIGGSSYVLFGGNFTGGGTQVGGDGADTLTANLGPGVADVLIGGPGDDTLVSDGGPDSLRGGEGDDLLAIPDTNFFGPRRIVGGTGTDTLRLDGVGLTLDLTELADNRIAEIESIDLTTAANATLTLDLPEVLNVSDSSNTLTIRANDDTINIGTGWFQQPDEIDSDGFLFEVFRQGAATLRITHGILVANLPAGNGADDVTIRKNGTALEVYDNNATTLLRNVPLSAVRSLQVTGGAAESNRLLVDYSFGGYFSVPGGITFVGTGGGVDELEVVGTGLTNAVLSSTSGGLDAGTFSARQGAAETIISFSGVEPVTAIGMLTFALSNEIDLGARTLTIDSTAFIEADSVITLGGGTLDLSGGGVVLDVASLLSGAGTVDGAVFANGGSTISAVGGLTLGDASAFDGFFSDGRLHTNTHTVMLLDANEAVLGSLTVLGSGGTSGTLAAANGLLLEAGKTLTGQGTVNGEFHNDGDVAGGGTGIVFNDLVTGIGSADNVTYNGGFSPGHSPAEVFLGRTASLGSANTLYIELGGVAPGDEFDRLASTGTVNLDGTLDVSFINGFVPANGDSFEIIVASAVDGIFDTTSLPALPLGLEWDIVYSADAVTLDVLALATAVTDTAFNAPAPNPNRSGIGMLDLTFDLPVNVAGVTSLSLFNHTTGQPINIATASLAGNGTPIVSWDLGSLTLPDGRYTAEITPGQATTTVGGPLASTYAIEFHVLRGDLDGDAIVNFNDTTPLSVNFGQTGAAYRPGDGDGDGIVNFNDTTPLSLNFGASLAPLTYDFGDAPETGTSFPTMLANNGPRHVIIGNTLFLGADRDAEADGQPSAGAVGDGADENGLVFDALIRGTDVNVAVASTGAGFLNGWVDFNQDGDWDDPGEQVLTDSSVVAGTNDLQITVPGGATIGSTFARFRLTGSAGHSYFGLAPNGEVEDYQLMVTEPAPDLPATVSQADQPESTETSMPNRTPPDQFLSIPTLAFTTFERRLSLFSTARESRSRRK